MDAVGCPLTTGVTNRFWTTNDGTFNTASNWEPEGVPATVDVAIFDRLSTYTVTVGMAQTLRLLVENGNVTFTGTQYNALGGDSAQWERKAPPLARSY